MLTQVIERSGLALDGTYLPDAIHPVYCQDQPRTDMATAMTECRMCVLGAIEVRA